MQSQEFLQSKECTIGVELELQILDAKSYNLINSAPTILDNLKNINYHGLIKPELTSSMIEFNTSIHENILSLQNELLEAKKVFQHQAKELDLVFCGGGTHPNHRWKKAKVDQSAHYKQVSAHYGYLIKFFMIFGQHIHIGCANGDDAIYLTHMMGRYIPHFLALSASSPFFYGVDTGFDSVRANLYSIFPTSGYIPYVKNWNEFSELITKMQGYKEIETIRDIYWDIRPRGQFGTIELRMIDMPLTVEKAVMLAVYAQALARYILTERAHQVTEELYFLYTYNRFQATRFGFNGICVDPYTKKSQNLGDDILATVKLIYPYAKDKISQQYLDKIVKNTLAKQNDAKWLRETYQKVGSFNEVVHEQTKLWMDE